MMKKILAMLLAVAMTVSLAACGQKKDSSGKADATVEETKPNYEEVVPAELQGVWLDTETEDILTLYAFQDDKVNTYVMKPGKGASAALSGTYTVEEGKVSYSFDSGTGYSNFTYEDEVFKLFNAHDTEVKKISAADLLNYLEKEESSSNRKGVVCLADLIINYYPDSAEKSTATEKKNAVNTAIKNEGKAALKNMRKNHDDVQNITWYEHKNEPKYVDITCFIYPYIGRDEDGNTWLRVKLNYTDAKTDAGWIFYDEVIFSVDGKNTTKSFSRSELSRDNDTEVWEVADFEPTSTEVELLEKIAKSKKTTIRFQGSEYYYDHVVTKKEKKAIKDVLKVYEYFSNQSK